MISAANRYKRFETARKWRKQILDANEQVVTLTGYTVEVKARDASSNDRSEAVVLAHTLEDSNQTIAVDVGSLLTAGFWRIEADITLGGNTNSPEETIEIYDDVG